MTKRRASSKSTAPPGFTLLEVVLVFGLLVVLAGLFWPHVVAMRDSDQLQRVSDNIRGVLVGLRVRAMREGKPHELTFQPDTGSFRIRIPGQAEDQASAASDQAPLHSYQRGSSRTGAAGSSAPQVFESDSLLGAHQLEGGLIFARVEAGDAPAQVESVEGVPIRFEPDGTATSIEFDIRDPLGVWIRFRVRGLTGAVYTSRPTGQTDVSKLRTQASGEQR